MILIYQRLISDYHIRQSLYNKLQTFLYFSYYENNKGMILIENNFYILKHDISFRKFSLTLYFHSDFLEVHFLLRLKKGDVYIKSSSILTNILGAKTFCFINCRNLFTIFAHLHYILYITFKVIYITLHHMYGMFIFYLFDSHY